MSGAFYLVARVDDDEARRDIRAGFPAYRHRVREGAPNGSCGLRL
jgi:hypothetical protein